MVFEACIGGGCLALVDDINGQRVFCDGDGLNHEASSPIPDVADEVAHHVHLFSKALVDVLKTARNELLVIGLKREGWESHFAITVISAGTAVGVQSLIGVLYRDLGDACVHGVSDAPEQLPVRWLFRPFAPRVENDPNAGVHRDIEVSVGNMRIDVSRIGCRFRFAEDPNSKKELAHVMESFWKAHHGCNGVKLYLCEHPTDSQYIFSEDVDVEGSRISGLPDLMTPQNAEWDFLRYRAAALRQLFPSSDLSCVLFESSGWSK